MRKILIKLLIVIAVALTISILWMFSGRQLSLFVDRFGMVEMSSTPISSLTYEGNGTGGAILVNDLHLNLTPANPQDMPPNIGTAKDGQLALSFGGRVFAFSPLRAIPESAEEILATTPQGGDDASISIRRSALSWIEPLNFNFMTGQSPSWKRHVYYQLLWKRASGPKLEMLWRYEQYSYPATGWGSAFMTHEGSTGLIRIDLGL